MTSDEKKILFPGDIVDGETLGKIAPKFSRGAKNIDFTLEKK